APAGVRRRAARCRVRRHRRRRGEDRHALLAAADRHGRGLPRAPEGAARRRPRHGRELGRAPARARRGVDARRPPLPARDGRHAEPPRGGRAGRPPGGDAAAGARGAPPRARRGRRDRHRRPRAGGGRPPLRRRRARRDPGPAPRHRRDARRRLHPLGHARSAARARAPAPRRRPARGRDRGGRGRPGPRRARGGRGAGRRNRPAGGRVSSGGSLRRLRERRPLVHQITNYVVMNETANATLALGALPVMAHAREEVEEMVALAGALVLNIGTLSPPWVEAMLAAGRAANARGVPVVLDPVGAGATRYRTETARRILEEVDVAVLRGNAGEVATLVGVEAEVRGVESIAGGAEPAELARRAAGALGVVAAVTGAVDHVSDGERVVAVANGHPLLAAVSGTGCMSSAVTGCFLAVAATPL